MALTSVIIYPHPPQIVRTATGPATFLQCRAALYWTVCPWMGMRAKHIGVLLLVCLVSLSCEQALGLPGGLVKARIAGACSAAQDVPVLTSSPGMLMLGVQEPHFENQWFSASNVWMNLSEYSRYVLVHPEDTECSLLQGLMQQ